MWHFVEQEACSLTATGQETKEVKMILVRSESFNHGSRSIGRPPVLELKNSN
jgi:hypothetical protein